MPALSEREIKRLVKELGAEVVSIKKTRHLRVVIRRSDGTTFLSIFPQTPSCHHWRENKIHELKKYLVA